MHLPLALAIVCLVTACQNEKSDKSRKEAVPSADHSQEPEKDASAATQAAIPATATKESSGLPTKITVRPHCSCGGNPTKQYHRCIDPDEMAYFVRQKQKPMKCPGGGGCRMGGTNIVYQLCEEHETNVPLQRKLIAHGGFPGVCYGTYPQCTNFAKNTIPTVRLTGRTARGWQNGAAIKIGDETFRIRCIQLAHSETCENPHSGDPIAMGSSDVIILDRLPAARIESGDVVEYLGERDDPVPPIVAMVVPIAAPASAADSIPATHRGRLVGSLPGHCVGSYPDCSNLGKHSIPYIHVRRTRGKAWPKGATVTVGDESFKVQCMQDPAAEDCAHPITGKPLPTSFGSELLLLDRWPKKRLHGGQEIFYNP
jgi:uncharacterized Zn-binding protein involved in type VI secretion